MKTFMLGLGFFVALAACGKESAPAGTPTDSPSAAATTTASAPATSASATPAATAPATATASAAPIGSASPAVDAGAMPKLDPVCKADKDCDLYMEGSAKDPCCPVCPNWKAATKTSVSAFHAWCGSAGSACPVSCASVPMKAICKAGACAAVPAK